jgi:hypothetical protein
LRSPETTNGVAVSDVCDLQSVDTIDSFSPISDAFPTSLRGAIAVIDGPNESWTAETTCWLTKILVVAACVMNFSCSLFDATFALTPHGNSFAKGEVTDDSRLEQVTVPVPGDVVIFGGVNSQLESKAKTEFYDPATGKFVSTGRMRTSRVLFCSAFLATLNDILVAGGLSGEGTISGTLKLKANALDSAEVYDDITGIFSLQPHSMQKARFGCTATVFPSGPLADDVLIAGGIDENGNVLDSAELYDPSDRSFTLIASNMSSPRAFHTATLLGDGTVFVAGGFSDTTKWDTTGSADIFDPVTGTFSPTGSLGVPRAGASAILVSGTGPWAGTVLVAGGAGTVDGSLSSALLAELYCPAPVGFICANTFTKEARTLAGADDLGNGHILLTGGLNGSVFVKNGKFKRGSAILSDSAEIVDLTTEVPSSSCIIGPSSGVFGGCKKSMTKARAGHSATLFTSGPDANEVLVAGGVGGPSITGPFHVLQSAEIFNPVTGKSTTTGPMESKRMLHEAVLLP